MLHFSLKNTAFFTLKTGLENVSHEEVMINVMDADWKWSGLMHVISICIAIKKVHNTDMMK